MAIGTEHQPGLHTSADGFDAGAGAEREPGRRGESLAARLGRRDWVLIALLLAGTFALYLHTARFDFIGFDDPMYVSANWHIRSGLSWANVRWVLTDTSSSNWHPVTYLGYLLLAGIFGDRAPVFHLTNALLHAVNVALLYVFLKKTTRMTWPSLAAAALWGWHPQRAESVAWISELKDVLSGMWCLCCLLAYVRFSRERRGGWYVLMLGFFVLALLSKPMAVTMPVILLLVDFWPLRLRWTWWRIAEKVPLIVAAGAAAGVAMVTQTAGRSERTLGQFPMGVRIENALVSYLKYIEKTFVPRHLSAFYPHPQLVGESIGWMRCGAAGLLLLVMSVAVIWQRKRRPFLFTGWFWFLIALLPVIGLVQVGDQAMADRYTYLPCVGLIVAVVWLAWETARKFRWGFWIFEGGALAAAIVLVILANREIGLWRDTVTIFSHADEVTKKNFLARAIIAEAIENEPGESDRALELARSSVEVCPSRPYTHHVLAKLLEAHGLYHEAFKEYEISLHLDSGDANTFNDFGGLLVKMGRDKEAMDQFKTAIRLDPSKAVPRHNLAIVLANHDHLDEAIEQWKEALRYDPQAGAMHGWLAEALRMRGDRAGAIGQYRAAMAAGEHNPSWEANFAWLVATDRQSTAEELDEAVSAAKDACANSGQDQLGPFDALGAALARVGEFDDAIRAAEHAEHIALSTKNAHLAGEIEMRLKGYRAGRAFLVERAGG